MDLQAQDGQSPDKWVLLTISNGIDTVAKILSGWHGSYLGGDSWRLSSDIVDYTEDDKCYHLKTQSGSTYTLYKHHIGFTNMSLSIYESQKQLVADHREYSIILADTLESVAEMLKI
jgi:hypothetical protein